ncbi:hypothetical protein DN068_04090 [Taibaiella soli]|uniref:Uncharacterized protein n=1 Tax=Taibaiella soli TaxID=1649169 RepID=A0A2W2BLA2_9BACT|nr:hypothetical protein DN068_04090 [Taibaiella soli]
MRGLDYVTLYQLSGQIETSSTKKCKPDLIPVCIFLKKKADELKQKILPAKPRGGFFYGRTNIILRV